MYIICYFIMCFNDCTIIICQIVNNSNKYIDLYYKKQVYYNKLVGSSIFMHKI